MYTTGSSVDTTIPEVVASNLAGAVSHALFQRVARNAPGPSPSAIDFSPRSLYATVWRLLSQRAVHTLRLSQELDDNLSILHPGIEPWLEEHGHVAEWSQAWGPLAPDGRLALPPTFDLAPVGCGGGCGAPLLPAHVSSRLTLSSSRLAYRGPLPAPCPQRVHVCLRLSVGLRLGAGWGTSHVPTYPSLDSWPLPVSCAPEYRVDRILAERTLRGGTRYLVKWSNHTAPTWEPASNLAGCDALDRWLLH